MPKSDKKQREGEAQLHEVGVALDSESYTWLNDNRPDLAAAIDLAVDRGQTPMDIRRYVMRQTGRLELAARCQQYARAVKRAFEGEQ